MDSKKRWRENNSNYFKEYYAKNSETLKARSRRWHHIYKKAGKRPWIERMYGITQDDYEGLLAAQGFRCALCRKTKSSDKRGLVIDHCHKTGNVRGILCLGCNNKIAVAENLQFLGMANIYLTKTPFSIYKENLIKDE